MKPRLYIETSIVSYLTARPSANLITAARQQMTHEWWHNERHAYELFISEAVVAEARKGNPGAAALRLAVLTGLPEALLSDEVRALAKVLLNPGPIPDKASVDATHIAVATVAGAAYLLTWNFKHLANVALRKRIDSACRINGYDAPVICTPEDLLYL